MNAISLLLGQDAEFDKAIRGPNTLPDRGDLKIITKDKGTEGGNPIAVLTFTVQLPDGKEYKAQTVTTVRLLLSVLAGLRGRYGDLV
jgi:hypothetical protein